MSHPLTLLLISRGACIARTDNEPSEDGPVRLWRNGQSSPSYTSGVVQVYDNEWGNICNDDGFDGVGADVICKQLGYIGSSSFGLTGDGALLVFVAKIDWHALQYTYFS